MKLGSSRRLILGLLVVLILAASVSILVSLHGDMSALGALASDVMKGMGWSADSTAVDVWVTMSRYQKRGRYDDAIKAGVTWTEKHPNDDWNFFPYVNISALYLEKAKKDSAHADEYVSQAMVYRDKAIPLASEDTLLLTTLASLSESAGDLSPRQRCDQYQNAINLLQRVAARNEKLAQAVTRLSTERAASTRNWINGLSEKTDAAVARVKVKLQDSGCQQA